MESDHLQRSFTTHIFQNKSDIISWMEEEFDFWHSDTITIHNDWPKVWLNFNSVATALLVGIFSELFLNLFTYNKYDSASPSLHCSHDDIFPDFLCMTLRNSICTTDTFLGSTESGLDSLGETLHIVNGNFKGEHIMDTYIKTSKSDEYLCRLWLRKDLFIKP